MAEKGRPVLNTGIDIPGNSALTADFTEGLDDRDIVFLYTGQYDWEKDAYHYAYNGLVNLFPLTLC